MECVTTRWTTADMYYRMYDYNTLELGMTVLYVAVYRYEEWNSMWITSMQRRHSLAGYNAAYGSTAPGRSPMRVL